MHSPLNLVTGAPGWLGTRFVQVLNQGMAEVPGLEHPKPGVRIRCLVQEGDRAEELLTLAEDIDVVIGDLRDPEAVDRFVADAEGATLFHLASVIHPPGRTRDFRSINVEGTRRLLTAAAQNRVKRFVYVSSNSPVGVSRNPTQRFDEWSDCRPYMGYGRSKLEAELLVDDAWRSAALETVILRAPWFYGPGQPLRQGQFFSMLRTGKMPLFGDGLNIRSMTYIDHLCQALILAELVEDAMGKLFWIADPQPYSMVEIYDTVRRVMAADFGLEVSPLQPRYPGFICDLAEIFDATIQAVGFYHARLHVLGEMNKTISCTVGKAVRELGYRPHISFEEGMRRSLHWMLAQGQEI